MIQLYGNLRDSGRAQVVSGRMLRQREAAVARLGAIRRASADLNPLPLLQASEAEIDARLRKPLVALALEAMEKLDEVAGTFDEESEISGLCFAARLDLGQGRKTLEASNDREKMLVACDVLRQRIARSIAAVAGALEDGPDASIAREEGRAAALVRGMYMRLRAALQNADRGDRLDLVVVEAALEEMVGRREYQQIRLSDRFVVEAMRQRVAALSGGRAPSDEVAQLVSDARAMVELLASISLRPELREYDLRSIEAVLPALDENRLGRSALVQVRELLRGRDEKLDAALQAATATALPTKEARRDLLSELLRVRDALSARAMPNW